jgi:hypothetical protein
MAIALTIAYTPPTENWFPELDFGTVQCASWPLSSLLLVAHKIDATKTAMMTGTTR